MKLLSIAVPCYNSEKYMKKCVDSLLAGGEDVEIIIVDDGSTEDRTAEIADEYAANYPSIVRVVHQTNGGHGAAVNTGIANASGMYFKVVASVDWVNRLPSPWGKCSNGGGVTILRRGITSSCTRLFSAQGS